MSFVKDMIDMETKNIGLIEMEDMSMIISAKKENNESNISEERAVLTFGGRAIRSKKELCENFDCEAGMKALQDGSLYRWLKQHYYEQEADKLQYLDSDAPDCLRELCEILSLNYMDYKILSEEEKALLEEKRTELRKYTADEEVFRNIHLVAMNQEELADLLDAGEQKIYLCHNEFTIPLSKPDITYLGIGTVEIENPFTEEQYQKVGIRIEGITLPDQVDPDTERYAHSAAIQNGYDDFSENHSVLATAFHGLLKADRVRKDYRLPMDTSVAGTFFTSKAKCETAKKAVLKKAYDEAVQYITPGSSRCIVNTAVQHYSEHIGWCFSAVMDDLETYCQIVNKENIFREISEKIRNCNSHLRELFTKELSDNADYYKMYQFDYFMSQVDMEEHDYRVFEDFFSRMLETVLTDNVQYTITNITDSVFEMENDLNDYANTFFKTIHNDYLDYAAEIEELIDGIGKDLPEIKAGETLDDYLSRLCGNK